MKTIYIGTALIDSIIKNMNPEPVSATGYVAESACLSVGGEAVNGSTTLSALGGNVSVLAFIGSDPAGKLIEDTLKSGGVDTSHLIHPANAATPVSTLLVHADGSRHSITNGAHRYNFHPERYLEGLFENADAAALTSLFRTPFNDPEIIYQVLKAAKDHGLTTYADTKLPNFGKLTLDDIRDSLPLIDYITPNEDEARYYTGENDPEKAADVFLHYGVKNVIVKLGAKGCIAKYRHTEKHSLIRLPAYPVDAVDATGAGDAFLAGLIACGKPGSVLSCDSIRFASACGALCATQIGAVGAIRCREDVEALMRSYPCI